MNVIEQNISQSIKLKPIISYPREAQIGKPYLMSIDVELETPGMTWPYSDEEYAISFLLNTHPFFSYEPIGDREPSIVLHRFGGTYGPAEYLLTASNTEVPKGTFEMTFVNGSGIPIAQLELECEVKQDVEFDAIDNALHEITITRRNKKPTLQSQSQSTANGRSIRTDEENRQLHINGIVMQKPLSLSEVKFMSYLASHNGELCSNEELIQVIFGQVDPSLGKDRLDAMVGRIRKKIGDTRRPHRILITVRGRGYRLGEYIDKHTIVSEDVKGSLIEEASRFENRVFLPQVSLEHIQIFISRRDNVYIADILTGRSKPIRIRIDLTDNDIASLSSLIQDAFLQLAKMRQSTEHIEEGVKWLAQQGNYALRRIFLENQLNEILKEMVGNGISIQIVSEDFFIPWELLYDGPLGDHVDVSHFWGMRHIISRAFISDTNLGVKLSPVSPVTRLSVGLIASDRIPAVIEEEIPFLRHLHQQRKISLAQIVDLNPKNRDSELEVFGQLLRQDFQILHFACHAYEARPLENSYLIINKNFTISLVDFKLKEFKLDYKPFVILNVGMASPSAAEMWAKLFWEIGARGVVVPEFRASDLFASAFIESIYKYLLQGKSIGESILAARLSFWEQQQTLEGLAYALYASASFKIVN